MRAERRAPISAALIGLGVGLGLGATYLVAGMGDRAADYAHAQRMTEAATRGYAGSHLEAEGAGLRTGLQLYGLRDPVDALNVGHLFGAKRPEPAKAGRRADLECLTQAVYYEARGESSRGQYAVAQVVMNRVRHPAFPKSVCAVVFQGAGRRGCQFSFACDGSMRARREAEAWAEARRVAARALAGAALADIGSATHFHTTAVSPIWAPQMLRVSQVGMHVFYRFSPRKARSAPVLASVEKAVLTSGPLPAGQAQPAAEKAIEASLEPAAAAAPIEIKAKPAAPPPPAPAAEEAKLSLPQTTGAF
ncbi:MAG: cell wall hydrolase [Phenylobacterium sp.]|nr:cell wall hydrolase [Phenylobacterium sp.]